MRSALRLLPGLLPLLLAACLAPRAATVDTAHGVQEPAPIQAPQPTDASTASTGQLTVEISFRAAPERSPRTWTASSGAVAEAALEELTVPPDCQVDAAAGSLTVRCAEDQTLVELRDQAGDLDGLQSETLALFVQRGALAATLGSPGCKVDGQEADCAYVSARSDQGLVGTAYLAVGDDWALRCVYFSGDRYYERADPVCHQLLKLG